MIILQTTVTIPILATFPGDCLSSVLVNSAAKIFTLSLGCHPTLDGITRGGLPLPLPPSGDATAVCL